MEKFYESLKEHRLTQNISLEDISQKTKISLKFLKALEEGNFEILPYTYVRLFLRAYAQEINADPQEALNALEKYLQSEGKLPQGDLTFQGDRSEIPEKKSVISGVTPGTPLKKLKLSHGLVILAVLLFLIVIAQQLFKEKSQNEPPLPPPIDTVKSQKTIPDTTSNPEISKSIVAGVQDTLTEAQIEPMQLQIVTTDSVWIRISTDDNDPREYLFAPNRNLTWTARQHFKLRIGRPTAVKMFLNGEPLDYPFTKNAIDFMITRNGIIQILQ